MPETKHDAPPVDPVAVLEQEECSLDDLLAARPYVYSSYDARVQVDEVLKRLERGLVKLSAENKVQLRRGCVLWLLGRNDEAIEVLKDSRLGRDAYFVLGRSYLEKGNATQAIQSLEKAAEGENVPIYVHLALIEARNRLGRHDEAYAALQPLKKHYEGTAEYQYALGFTLDHIGRYADAEMAYRKALGIDPEDARSLFRLAYNADLRGEEDKALEIYERLRKGRPPHVNALLNLGLMYEDRCSFEKAIDCYQTILDTYPFHERAQLYLADSRASLNMYYDEDARKKEHKVGQMLGTPISEFQLSVRSRNCLAKIGVNSLGDMVKKTEAELLGCKNFGETSLREVRELLRQRGLVLAKTEAVTAKAKPLPILGAAGKEDAMTKPIGELEWSARARKCMDRLGLQTLGDLCAKSEAELLGIRNFGLTSLNEIRQKLTQMGLSLKTK